MLMKNLYLVFFMLPVFLLNAQDYNTLIYRGNKSFEARKYDDASAHFLEAIRRNEKGFAGHYNLGNALYKRKMFHEAEAEYKRAEALSKTPADKAAALYNQGNAAMKAGDAAKAANLYKKALKISPETEAIRKNYEIAMLRDKEQNRGGGQDKQQQQSQQPQQGDQGEQNDQGDPKNNPSGSGQEQQGQGQGNDANKQRNTPGMSKETEERILRRTEDKERDTARRILNQKANNSPLSNEKNW